MAQVTLPSEAVRAILAFMTRKQLMELIELNYQFYSLINSSPFVAKPLLRLFTLYTYFEYSPDMVSWDWHPNPGTGFADQIEGEINGYTAIDTLLGQEWLRIEYVNIVLPPIQEEGRPLLELLVKNSRCLRGANTLWVTTNLGHYERMLPEIAALIDELRPLFETVHARPAER